MQLAIAILSIMKIGIMTNGIMTVSVMTLTITTLCMTALAITMFGISTLRLVKPSITTRDSHYSQHNYILNNCDTQHNINFIQSFLLLR
jgi:hypothetical protein